LSSQDDEGKGDRNKSKEEEDDLVRREARVDMTEAEGDETAKLFVFSLVPMAQSIEFQQRLTMLTTPFIAYHELSRIGCSRRRYHI
jgi:hypothetical protein